jgi:protein dithiol:quinone oxidoreductase
MFSFFKAQSRGVLFWWMLILLGLLSEGVALFYQYVLEYGPCPLCIHTRILVLASILVACAALVIRATPMIRIFHLFNTGIMVWLCERSYILLGTERGFVLSECGVDSGLPSWFALDEWFPAVFGVMESCGYTPLMPFGVSMAEVMIVVYPMLLLLSLLLLIASLLPSGDS